MYIHTHIYIYTLCIYVYRCTYLTSRKWEGALFRSCSLCAKDMFLTSLAASTGVDPSAIEIASCPRKPQ